MQIPSLSATLAMDDPDLKRLHARSLSLS